MYIVLSSLEEGQDRNVLNKQTRKVGLLFASSLGGFVEAVRS